ncbi:hypothetical protein K470DRAFT_258172 [Piedraia hortae CBS 480.64]|uniref:Uncharacterized protein n=1 Tax=Piedraia hortae CBS 480.64 TaxID=1314780 RepID=A0A6A7BZV4_9PEZI|nr:hypothetical protein K470DRAFT_258172 [Piedraia hortae CBS 480.64]
MLVQSRSLTAAKLIVLPSTRTVIAVVIGGMGVSIDPNAAKVGTEHDGQGNGAGGTVAVAGTTTATGPESGVNPETV